VNSGAPEELAVPAPLKYVDFDLIIVDFGLGQAFIYHVVGLN
jgi:hypothetical protein